MENKQHRCHGNLYINGSEIAGILASQHDRQGEFLEVCRRAISFTSRAEVEYHDKDNVPIDVLGVIDEKLRAKMISELASLGRFYHR